LQQLSHTTANWINVGNSFTFEVPVRVDHCDYSSRGLKKPVYATAWALMVHHSSNKNIKETKCQNVFLNCREETML
jgi:hypothetical protein